MRAGRARIPHPFLAVIGNLTPDMLGELADRRGRADGFTERLLFAFPDPSPRPYWSDEGFPDEEAAGWAEIIRRLRARPMMHPDGGPQPHPIAFAPEAHARWVRWYNAHVDEVNAPGYDRADLAVEGKLCDFAGRFALILHLLDLAAEPDRGDAEPIPPASPRAVEGAIALWNYFRAMHRRARWWMNGGVGNPIAREILAWARRNSREEFTVKELTDDLRWLADRPGEPAAALRWLEQRHLLCLRPVDRPESTRGRKPSPRYAVHPDLLDCPPNTRNTRNSAGVPPDLELREFREYSGRGEGEHETS